MIRSPPFRMIQHHFCILREIVHKHLFALSDYARTSVSRSDLCRTFNIDKIYLKKFSTDLITLEAGLATALSTVELYNWSTDSQTQFLIRFVKSKKKN